MGWLRVLMNLHRSDGMREVIRLSYDKVRRGAAAGTIRIPDGMTAHQYALASALTKSDQRAKQLPEPLLHGEISPFCLMPLEEMAVKALAEYVLFRQSRRDVQVDWLSRAMSEAVTYHLDQVGPAIGTFIILGYFGNAPWRMLIDSPAGADIEGYAERRAWSDQEVFVLLRALAKNDTRSAAEMNFEDALMSFSDSHLQAALGFFEGVANGSLPRNFSALRKWINEVKEPGASYGNLVTASVSAEGSDSENAAFHRFFMIALEIKNRRFCQRAR